MASIMEKLNKIDTLVVSVNEIKHQIKDLSTELNGVKMIAETAEAKAKAATEAVKVAADTLNTAIKEIEQLKVKSHQVDVMNEKLIKQEAYSRCDNILIDGIPETVGESNIDCIKKVLNIFETTMGIENASTRIKIVRAHRIGPVRKFAIRPRTMIVKFHWYQDKMEVWSRCDKLRGSNIWLSDDYPAEWAHRRQILKPVMKAAKQMKMNASMSEDKLIINKGTYTVHSLHKLPEALDLCTIWGSSDKNVLAFWNRECPFSNFFPSPITVENITYSSVEEYFQCQKAEACDREDLISHIRSLEDPAQQKRLTNNLESPKWLQSRCATMTTAVRAKFTQNDHLKKLLLHTKDKILVEASPHDKFWGAGLSTKDRNIDNPDMWPGENHLGRILGEVRDLLSSA